MLLPGGEHLLHQFAEVVVLDSGRLTAAVAILFKILAILIGTVVGAIGLSKESVDPVTKKLTKWGRIGLVAVLSSGVVAVVSQGVESYLTAKSEKELHNSIETELAYQHKTLDSEQVLLTNINRGLYPFSVDTTANCRLEIPLQQRSIDRDYAITLRTAAASANGVVPLDPGDPLCPSRVPAANVLNTLLQQVLVDVSVRKDHDFDPREEKRDVAFRMTPAWTAGTIASSSTEGPITRPMARAFYSAKRDAIVLEATNWLPDWIDHDPSFVSLLDFKNAFVNARVTTNGYGVNVNVVRVGLADRTGRGMYMNGFHVADGVAGIFKTRMPANESDLWKPGN